MSENDMQEKMNYCLNCKIKPCSNKGCPLENDIPTFIKLAKEGKIEDAYATISKTSVLPGICGRVCPHKKQCEGSCVRGIKGDSVDIGTIESYIFDKAMEQGYSTAPEEVRALGFGAGMGLPNMKKYSDYMNIDSTIGVGTTVTMDVHF